MDYRCRECGALYNLYTNTILIGVRRPCSTVILMPKGFAEGTPSKHLAAELHMGRIQVMQRRHRVQALLEEHLSPVPYRTPASNPTRCIRMLARRESPISTQVIRPDIGPTSNGGTALCHRLSADCRGGRLRERPDPLASRPAFGPSETRTLRGGQTVIGATVHADEYKAYDHLPATDRAHKAINHPPGQREWAQNDDGDGIRVVHAHSTERVHRNILKTT